MRSSVVIVLTWVLLFSASPSSAAGDIEKLFAAVDARLLLMKPVAAWKLDKSVPVEDLAREKVVLGKATASAEDLGIDAESTRAFFQAQIDAAKEIQRCWIERWRTGAATKPADYPDLKTEIRPELIRLGREILTNFKSVLKKQTRFAANDEAQFSNAVQIECLSAKSALTIFGAIKNVRLSIQ